MHTHTHAYAHTHTCICICTHTHMHMHMHAHTHTHAYAYAHTRTHVYVYMQKTGCLTGVSCLCQRRLAKLPTRTRHSLVMDPTRKRALRLQSDIHDPCHWCGFRRPHVALWRQVTLVNWVLVAGHQFVLQHTCEVYQNQEVLTCVV